MIGIIIVAHGDLAKSLKSAVEHVVGKQENIKAICINPNDNMDARRQNVIEAIDELDTGSGVIILTDLFGGTPSNMAIGALGIRNAEVIAGVNLPMLVKLVSVRSTKSVKEAVQMAQNAGRKYIHVASSILDGEISNDDLDEITLAG